MASGSDRDATADFIETMNFREVFDSEPGSDTAPVIKSVAPASTCDGTSRRIAQPVPADTRVGLALSGGGIRSGAFSLGVLQALNAHGLFKSIDYLSTVSGGGYIGAALIARLARNGNRFPFAGGETTDTGGMGENDIADNEEVRQIRDRSRYLMPNGKFDLVVSLGIILRGLIANILMVAAAVFAAAAVTLFFSPTRYWLEHSRLHQLVASLPDGVAQSVAPMLAVFGETLVFSKLLGLLLCLWLAVWAVQRSSPGPGGGPASDTQSRRAVATGCALLGLAVVLVVELQPVIIRYLLQFVDDSDRLSRTLARFDGLAASLAAGTGVLAISWKTLSGIIQDASKDGTWAALFKKAGSLTLLVALSLALPLLIYLCYLRLCIAGILANAPPGPAFRAVSLADIAPLLDPLLKPWFGSPTLLVPREPVASWLPLMTGRLPEAVLLFCAAAAAGFVFWWTWREQSPGGHREKKGRLWIWLYALAVLAFMALAGAALSGVRGTPLALASYAFVALAIPLVIESRRTGIWSWLRAALCGGSSGTKPQPPDRLSLAPNEAASRALLRRDVLAVFVPLLGFLALFGVAMLLHVDLVADASPDLRIAVEILAYAGLLALVSLLLSENANSLHGLYRDRLNAAFDYSVGNGPARFSDLGHVRPYPIVNAAINIQGSKYNNRGRNADFFMFTPDHIGSETTGYVSTAAYEGLEDQLDLATAVAISGAAASAAMGKGTVALLAPTLALLNVRLAFWLRNPNRLAKAGLTSGARAGDWKLAYLWLEMFGLLDETRSKVYVSDGGHIDNLGLYQLLKRRCAVIFVVDAEQDPAMVFSSLVDVQRYARIDLGVRIELPVEALRDLALKRRATLAKEGVYSALSPVHGHSAIGRISYPEIRESGRVVEGAKEGILVYVKAAMTGDETGYVLDYERRYPAFPHESTGDQFFSEEQFEAYRALGFHSLSRAWETTDGSLTANRLRQMLGERLGADIGSDRTVD